jgi:hypothetical protein
MHLEKHLDIHLYIHLYVHLERLFTRRGKGALRGCSVGEGKGVTLRDTVHSERERDT